MTTLTMRWLADPPAIRNGVIIGSTYGPGR
jgi:hypothetical protein